MQNAGLKYAGSHCECLSPPLSVKNGLYISPTDVTEGGAGWSGARCISSAPSPHRQALLTSIWKALLTMISSLTSLPQWVSLPHPQVLGTIHAFSLSSLSSYYVSDTMMSQGHSNNRNQPFTRESICNLTPLSLPTPPF